MVYAITSHFYKVPQRTSIFIVAKMVGLDKSHKYNG
jgi:hypothetical protein